MMQDTRWWFWRDCGWFGTQMGRRWQSDRVTHLLSQWFRERWHVEWIREADGFLRANPDKNGDNDSLGGCRKTGRMVGVWPAGLGHQWVVWDNPLNDDYDVCVCTDGETCLPERECGIGGWFGFFRFTSTRYGHMCVNENWWWWGTVVHLLDWYWRDKRGKVYPGVMWFRFLSVK